MVLKSVLFSLRRREIISGFTVCLLHVPFLAACVMEWEECTSSADCLAPRVCQLGKCVLPDGDVEAEDWAAEADLQSDLLDLRTDPDPFPEAETQADAVEDAPADNTCPAGCTDPPGPCYQATGSCGDAGCIYPPRPAGDDCDDADPCTSYDQCDGSGSCTGQPMDCSRPHTTGGHCEDGACTGLTCVTGWGDCSGGMDDGCEASLSTAENCGVCGTTCPVPAHATASCATGTCVRTCTDPYENCDGDWSNGCEIPTGVTNRCDKFGLNSTEGCGTAWCGSSSSTAAQNFGAWYCIGCSHCHHFSDGYTWCLGLTISGDIRWSSDRCTACCGTDDQDHVCGP